MAPLLSAPNRDANARKLVPVYLCGKNRGNIALSMCKVMNWCYFFLSFLEVGGRFGCPMLGRF